MNKLENIFSNKTKNNGSLFHKLNHYYNPIIKVLMLTATLLLLFMVCVQSANAAEYNITPGTTTASIQTVFTNAVSGDTITFQNGTHTLTASITVANTPVTNKNLIIKGEGNTIINAASYTFLNISAGAATNNQRTINISNMQITGTTSDKIYILGNNIVNINSVMFYNITGNTGRGIAITASYVDVTVNNSRFINLTSGSVAGKGIDATTAASFGSLKIYNSNFTNLITSSTGSAINYYAPSSSYLYINNSNFETCYGGSVGGTIRNYGGAGATINHTNFTDCKSTSTSTLTGSSHGGVFCFNGAGSYLVVDNSRFTNCYSASEGGVHYAHTGPTTMTNTVFENCVAGVNGGAIFNNGNDTIVLTNCTFTDCKANNGAGGAIYANTGLINLTNCRFINNTANTQGGAINVANGNINLVGSNFTLNVAGTYGGAIASGGSGTINIGNSIFINNTAANYGGAIGASSGTINVDNSTRFTNNSATNFGGAVGANGGRINVNNSFFTSNFVRSTGSYGGALGTPSGTIIVYNSEFTFNNATNTNSYGGVAGVNGASAAITLVNCTVHDNSADFSGAFGAGTNGGTINVINNTAIYNNHANTYGGVVGLNGPGTISISNSVIYNNDAGTYGGAFAANGGTITVTNSTIRNNTAGTFGGAVAVNGAGTINIIDSNMTDNTATTFGGAAGVSGAGTINITNSQLNRNKVTAGFGGAVGTIGGNIYITGSNLTNNNASTFGGAAGLNGSGRINITNSNLNNNRAGSFGGAAGLNGSGIISITGSNMTFNFANTFGGATGLNGDGTISITNSNMNNNNASDFGGAAGLNGDGTINITNANMFDNIALVFGGAVGVTSPTGTGTINVRNSTLNRNRATGPDGYGGAVGLTQGNINVYDSVFNNNSATTYGGAVGVPLTGKFYADMSVFNGNVAGTYGGAIGSAAGVNITYCNFTSNRAGTDGGAVAATGSSDVNNSILSCQFEYNFAGRLGYAIYAANNLTANYNRFFNNTDASGSLRNTIATNEALSYPTVNIDFNWWGDNIPCAGNITPNNWVTVNVDCDNPIIAGGYANYTYTIRLAGDPSSFTGWNASRLPPFMGKGVFTTPPGIPVQEFDAHADITISVPYDASNRYQTGYFQVDNWFSSFTIDTRIKPNVTINAPTGRYKDNVTLTATYTDSIGNPIQGLVVNFYVGGVLVGTNTTDVNGYVTCRYTVASAGNLLYAAYYTGNHPLWGPINATQMLTFTKLPTTTTVTSVNDPIIVATRNNITATVLDFYGAPVVGFMVDFYVNGTYLGSNRTNAQGIAFYSFMANDDPNSQYNFTAIFNETGNFTSSRGDIIDTTARKMDTSIVISQVTTKPFRDARIAITLLNEFGDPISGGTITGTIDSTPFVAITGANGVAYVYHTSLAAGNYIIIANYAGNYMYEASNENGILVVELLNTTVQFKNFIVKVLENATFIAILVDEDGRLLDSKSVDIFVDGNFIGTFTTDSKGQIFVNLGVLPKGEYPITAIYAGDYIVWTGCNVNGTLEVRPINTTVPISVEQDTNVSTTFKARLFDEFRKPLADKPLLFFLNGDFIGVAVTDANGIATLAYAYTPKGKITVEYLGDEIYRESMNNRAFGPYTIPFDQSNPNATNITKQNITIKNNTNKNDSEIDPNNEANNDLNKNPNKDNRNPAVAMLKTGNPFVMVLLCLLSIFFIGFNRRSKK